MTPLFCACVPVICTEGNCLNLTWWKSCHSVVQYNQVVYDNIHDAQSTLFPMYKERQSADVCYKPKLTNIALYIKMKKKG